MGKLTLSRKTGETIVIGANAEIEVVVSHVRGEHVDITVVADRQTPINRSEIYALSNPDWTPTLSPKIHEEKRRRNTYLRRTRSNSGNR